MPKEPTDLPKEQLDLPKEPLDLPSPDPSESYPGEVKTLLSWTSREDLFRKRGKQYYLTSLLIMLLVEVILFLFSQYLLMLVVASLVFVAFALNTVPPHNFHYRISTEGVTIEDHFFLWQELYDFYFRKIEGIEVLHIRTHSFIPGELTLTLGDIDKEHVKRVLLPFLPYREVIKSTLWKNQATGFPKIFLLKIQKLLRNPV